MQQAPRNFAAGSDIAQEGQRDRQAQVIDSGWCCTYKLLPDGSRQIVVIKIPGDIIGLRTILLRTSDHGCMALTPVVARAIHRAELQRAMISAPRLAAALLWSASRDEAMLVEHLVSLGRRDATARVAHFCLEMAVRLGAIGALRGRAFDLPVSQHVLADALGLTAIHVNRVLRRLREDGLLTLRDGVLTLNDVDALVGIAGFDRAYLDHEGGPFGPDELNRH